VILGTTDVHAWLLPWDYMAGEETDRGLALLAPIVDSVRAAHPGRVVLVDSGDLLQGSPMAAAYTPLAPGEVHPVITAMNLLEYDAAALGNHEFNFGIDHLERVLSDARFPVLAANVVDASTGDPVWPVSTLVELEVDGAPLVVGVTGVLPPGVAVWDRDHVEGRLAFPDILDRLRVVVPELRAAGADLVVVAAHSGFEGTSYDREATGLGPENQMAEVAAQVPGIDAIFMGHTHRRWPTRSSTASASRRRARTPDRSRSSSSTWSARATAAGRWSEAAAACFAPPPGRPEAVTRASTRRWLTPTPAPSNRWSGCLPRTRWPGPPTRRGSATPRS
jgi:2',3'-cyclic-nucleotide 2'-phosphodiesterase / 3'-nucleotidase